MRICQSRKGEQDIYLRGWIAAPDPDIFLYSNFTMEEGNQNWTFFENSELTKILRDGREMIDVKRRIELYKKAQEIIHRDLIWLPLYHSKFLAVHNKKIKDVFINSNSFISFRDAYKEK